VLLRQWPIQLDLPLHRIVDEVPAHADRLPLQVVMTVEVLDQGRLAFHVVPVGVAPAALDPGVGPEIHEFE